MRKILSPKQVGVQSFLRIFFKMTNTALMVFFALGHDTVFSKTILDLQAEKRIEKENMDETELELISLNPRVNSWFLFRYTDKKTKKSFDYNLDLADPKLFDLNLRSQSNNGIVIVDKSAGPDKKSSKFCKLWDKKPDEFNKKVAAVNRPYISLCEGKIYLRKKVEGQRSTKETVVEFLRDNIWGGDQITNVVKDVFYQDSHLSTAETTAKKDSVDVVMDSVLPKSADLPPNSEKLALAFPDLGLRLQDDKLTELHPGSWYPLQAHNQIYVSVIKPELTVVDTTNPVVAKRLGSLDAVEKGALVYSVAFDLSQFDLDFMMGTDHPRVDWSDRVPDKYREKEQGGPDGIADISPLITTGMVRPDLSRGVRASFAGGFKRSHGAFKWGPLSAKNRGSHYGYIEDGVIFSSLVPDLASLVIDLDGNVNMLSWTKSQDQGALKHARQNGPALVEYQADKNISVPGMFVNMWAEGNWSGSAEGKQRTVRAGACLQKKSGRDYLIYSYFSSVTPAAMARVFLSYGCQYAMHLDMNALEHTYLAIYSMKDKKPLVEHLIKGMHVLDRKHEDVVVPRFLGMADNRDFFYLKDKAGKRR